MDTQRVMSPREQVLGKLNRVPASNFIYAVTVPAFNFLYAGTVTASNFLYAGTVPAFNFLYAGTVPAYKHYQIIKPFPEF